MTDATTLEQVWERATEAERAKFLYGIAAAPDLLEALREIRKRLAESAGGGTTQKSRAALRQLASAAIAKAKP